jgi:hypothetical protein
MNGLDAIDTIDSWRHLLIEGNQANVDQLWNGMESDFGAKGWKREPAEEQKMLRSSASSKQWRCFLGGQSGTPIVMLGLTRATERRLRGGSYQLRDGPPNMQTTDVGRMVRDVIDHILTPSARRFGLTISIPRLGQASRVPPNTLIAMGMFSDLASGEWPIDAEHESLWRQFVIQACREDAAFDVDELTNWFESNGWNRTAADALVSRFISEAGLISDYADEVAK